MTVSALSQEHQDFYKEEKIIIKPLLMGTLIGILADVKYHKTVITLIFIAIHGKLILYPLQELSRPLSMGS